MRMHNGTTLYYYFCFSLLTCALYLCEMIFAIFCLYFIYIGIGYECFSCVVKINLGPYILHPLDSLTESVYLTQLQCVSSIMVT